MVEDYNGKDVRRWPEKEKAGGQTGQPVRPGPGPVIPASRSYRALGRYDRVKAVDREEFDLVTCSGET